MTALLELNRRLGLPAFPRYPRDREWRDLTASWDGLFVRVKDAVAELRQCPVHTIRAQRQEWDEVVSRWRECHLLAPEAVVDENRKSRAFEERRRHLAECEALKRILRCAADAAADPGHFSMADPSVASAGHEDPAWEPWRQICARLLRDPSAHLVRIAVPSVARTGGELAFLELTTIEDGRGQVYRHPVDVLASSVTANAPTAAFVESIESAWRAAREMLPATCARGVGPDGVWRLRKLASATAEAASALQSSREWDGEPIEAPTGPSAGGAAFRGWWHALQQKHPDDALIVIAQIERAGSSFSLAAVDPGENGGDEWLTAKVGSVVRDGRFDTIVVVNDKRNAEIAKSVCAGSGVRIVAI